MQHVINCFLKMLSENKHGACPGVPSTVGQPVWELVRRRKLGWASGTTTEPEKGSLCSRGCWEVRLGRSGHWWPRVSPPGSGRPLKNGKKVGRKLPLSACKPDTGESPLSSYPSTHTLFLQSKKKNRQSSLERAGPLEDLLLALSPMELVVYRSIFASAMCF